MRPEIDKRRRTMMSTAASTELDRVVAVATDYLTSFYEGCGFRPTPAGLYQLYDD